MIIPTDPERKKNFVRWLVSTCMESSRDRRALYENRRRYYYFGTNTGSPVKYNRLISHIDLVSAFLYSTSSARYEVSAPRNSEDATIKKFLAAEDTWNDEFRDSGLSDDFGEALVWSLVYDTMIMKPGWNSDRGQLFTELVHPASFGVFREDRHDIDSQEAMVHRYPLGWDEAVERIVRAGLTDRIADLKVINAPEESPFPELITSLIVAATGGADLAGNIMGQINPDYMPRPTYRANVDQPMIMFNEVWVWDSAAKDYRIFIMAEPDILLSDSKETIEAFKKVRGNSKSDYSSDTNLFLPKDHPFVKVQPHAAWDYFWGVAHIDPLIPLQDWSNDRLEGISDILDRQESPPKVFSGFMGLTDEKADAFGGPDTWVSDQIPGAKVESLAPTMPPDLFAEFKEIGAIFMEASGLTDTLQGRGEAGVRSRGHAKELKKTGSGRIQKTAIALEQPLVKLGDLGLKLVMKNDSEPITTDTAEKFTLAQLPTKFNMRIAGHSSSPLFADEGKEIAALLFKAQAIDREMLIRLLHPPGANNMIHALRQRLAAEKVAAAQHPPPHKGGKEGGKHGSSS